MLDPTPSPTIESSAADGPRTTRARLPSESVRTVVSLLLFIHVFCMVVALSSCFSPSRLQVRLASLFSPYTAGLYLDPNYLPADRRRAAVPPTAFHLTAGEGETRMHQWLLTTSEGRTYRYPSGGWPFQYRLDRLGRIAAYFEEVLERDEVPAEIAKALCRHLLSGLSPEERSGRIYVRCVRHLGEEKPSDFDLDGAADIERVYEADVWMQGPEGAPAMNVLKRTPRSQSALPVRVGAAP